MRWPAGHRVYLSIMLDEFSLSLSWSTVKPGSSPIDRVLLSNSPQNRTPRRFCLPHPNVEPCGWSPPVHGPPSSIQKRVLEGRGAREWGVRLLGRVKPRRSLASGGDTRRMSPRESGASETLGWSREPKERNAGWREGTCEIEGGRCGAARVSKGDE